MARLNKKGLYYFPMDVDFFEDDKIKLIESEFGMSGSYVAIRLLCKIYKENYYYQWGEDQCLLFAKFIGNGITPGLINEVINGLIRRGFFNKEVFESYKILTSRGIQNRYFDAVARYKSVVVIQEYLLVKPPQKDNIHINSINADKYEINVNINSNIDSTCTHNERERENEIKNEISNFRKLSFEEIKKILIEESQIWYEQIRMADSRITSDQQLKEIITKWLLKQNSTGSYFPVHIDDVRRHFAHSLPKMEIELVKTEKTGFKISEIKARSKRRDEEWKVL